MRGLILWLCRVFDVNPVEQSRLKAGGDAVQRGQRWESFYREEGGLADMIDALRMEAFEAAAELDPADADKIYYWATADRNLRKLQNRVEAVVAGGKLEAARIETLDRLHTGLKRA